MAGRVESARRAGSCVGSMARGTLTAASSPPPGVAPRVAVDLPAPPQREEPAPSPLAGELAMARAENDHLRAELKARREALAAERERIRNLKAQLERAREGEGAAEEAAAKRADAIRDR